MKKVFVFLAIAIICVTNASATIIDIIDIYNLIWLQFEGDTIEDSINHYTIRFSDRNGGVKVYNGINVYNALDQIKVTNTMIEIAFEEDDGSTCVVFAIPFIDDPLAAKNSDYILNLTSFYSSIKLKNVIYANYIMWAGEKEIKIPFDLTYLLL